MSVTVEAREASGVTSQALREAMVSSQLRTNAVSDGRVVAAMASVPREDYVPATLASLAYRDTAIPLGQGRYLNPPMATGRLLTAASLLATDRVLLIGAAGGYTAALLARIVAGVVAVESDEALYALAGRALAGFRGIDLRCGALTLGAPDGAPYDALVIDGAVEEVPHTLVSQVIDGGRVVAGLVDRGVTRLAAGRRSAGGFAMQPFADAECAVLPGFAAPPRFRF